MKNQEFYIKRKAKDDFVVHPIITKKNWWLFVVITILAVALEPVILLKYRKLAFASWQDYFSQVIFISRIIIPLEVLVLWFPQLREIMIRKKGFDWIGKFEVVGKEISFGFYYLILHPGDVHRIKVKTPFYERAKIGDHVIVRRNAMGAMKETVRIPNVRGRLARKTFSEKRAV